MVDIAKNHGAEVRAQSTVQALDVAPVAPQAGRPGSRFVRRGAPAIRGVAATSNQVVPLSARGSAAVRYLLAGIRIGLGWIFLWAFLDKTFGLGHDTDAGKSWINGGSPTKGFLGSAAKGPFAGFYHTIAGTGFANALFMLAVLGIGVALVFGIGMRVAAGAGALLTVMMWSVVLPPAGNVFLDEHLIYAAILIVLALLGAGNTLGLGRSWTATPLVQRARWLS
jgi:thiosulfate dehydrogenase (quinone) large subunit